MLDEAIEYMKSLQMQLQMMSMGYGMISMVYPGMQQYMPTMVMGMGMNMVPYPSMLPASSMQNPATTGPGFPMVPGFHPPQVPIPDHSRIQATNQTDSMLNSHINPNLQNFVDPYQHFLGPHQPQLPLPQNQARVTVKTNTSKEVGNPETKQSGRK